MSEEEEKPKPLKALTKKQKVFVIEYLRCFNAARSARLAGYSARTAYASGPALLKLPHIKAAIDEALAERQMGADEVKILLTDMARGDIGAFLDVSSVAWNIDLLQRDENGELLRDEKGRVVKRPETKLIKKMKQKVTTIQARNKDGEDREIIETEIELYDAQAALEKIGKYHGLFDTKIDLTSKGEKIVQTDKTDDQLRNSLTELAAILMANASGETLRTSAPDATGNDPGSEEEELADA